MGADGCIYIYDAKAIEKDNLESKFRDTFAHVYAQEIFGRRVFTAYADSEGRDLMAYEESVRTANMFDEYLIAEWDVWS